MSAVFVLRHAPSEHSAAYRVNGDSVDLGVFPKELRIALLPSE